MKNYINPFEERKFDVRFRAVFEFAKLNFTSVIKYYLLIFIVFAALYSAFLSFVPDFNARAGINGMVFLCFSYFSFYMINKGDVRAVSLEKRLSSIGIAFVKGIVVSLLLLVCMMPLIVLVVLLSVAVGEFLWIALIVPVFIWMFLFSNIIYAHYYFSNASKGVTDVIKEVFHMLKGHWWSTCGFYLIFCCILYGLVSLFSLLPLLGVVLLPDNAYVQFLCFLIMFTVFFIVSFFTTDASIVFQYGHLKALKEKQEQEREGDSVAKKEFIE